MTGAGQTEYRIGMAPTKPLGVGSGIAALPLLLA